MGETLAILAVLVGLGCFAAFVHFVLNVEPRLAAERARSGPGMAVAQPASFTFLGTTYRVMGVFELLLLIIAIVLTTGGAFRLSLGP
ncbi:MAG: hypothetical protein U1E56_04860 [Bauldia sp.]